MSAGCRHVRKEVSHDDIGAYEYGGSVNGATGVRKRRIKQTVQHNERKVITEQGYGVTTLPYGLQTICAARPLNPTDCGANWQSGGLRHGCAGCGGHLGPCRAGHSYSASRRVWSRSCSCRRTTCERRCQSTKRRRSPRSCTVEIVDGQTLRDDLPEGGSWCWWRADAPLQVQSANGAGSACCLPYRIGRCA